MEKGLPKNWIETELKEIISYKIGGDWGNDTNSIDDENFVDVLCIRGSEIKNWKKDKGNTALQRKIKKSSLLNRQLIKGDILLEISGGGPDQPVGRTVLIDDDVLSYNTDLAKVCTNFLRLVRIYPNINSKLINYYLQYFYYSGEITKYQGGSNNLRNLKYKDYETISIPLPPFAEQNRIVDKLDSLFFQVEIIKKNMERVPILLKKFRQQILTQATNGNLTEEYRDKEKLKKWISCTLLDVVIEKPRNGYSPKSVEYETAIKSLALSATTSGKFNPTYVKYLDIEAPKKESHLWLKNGDILIQRSNSLDYVGTSAIYDGEDFDFIYPDIMMKVRSNESILNIFLFYLLSAKSTRDYYRKNASGTAGNMPKINQEIVSRTPISLPSIQEQKEIVRRVKSLFTKADKIDQKYQCLKRQIDSLPQALLYNAFKGKLTLQLDSDGNSQELLEEIKKLQSISITNIKKSNETKPTTKKQIGNKKYLLDEIKNILKEKTNGISYKDLIKNFYDESQEDLVNDIIQQLLNNNIISQEFSIEQKQMLIKINR